MKLFSKKILSSFKRPFAENLGGSIEAFRTQISAHGLIPPPEVIADGQLHRFSSSGKIGDTAGWYVLYADPVPAGAFGCWRNQVFERWSAKLEASLTESDQKILRQRMDQAKQARDLELQKRQAAASHKAQKRWDEATPVISHPYLQRKGIGPHGLRLENDHLLVPLFDANGVLKSLQSIASDGEKRFMGGGQVAGCYCMLGEPGYELIVCEGLATGATLFEQTGLAVAIAFSASNLMAVAKTMREMHPRARIILAADNDCKTAGNPGITKAKEAAIEVRGRLAIPVFKDGSAGAGTDFNDLYLIQGTEAVVECIKRAKPVSPDGEIWHTPRPVVSELPPVQELTSELVPDALRGWITDSSVRIGCRPDFLAVAALVSLSSLVGARAAIAPKALDSWTVIPVLWGQIIAPPGYMKSPALSEAMAPLHRLELRDQKVWAAQHEKWRAEDKLFQMASDANERQAKTLAQNEPEKARQLLTPLPRPKEPKLRRRVMNDSSVEKLAEVLVDHPHGLLVYRDELNGLLTQMDKAGQEGARAFYLQGYDGNQSYSVDRIVRGSQFIPRVCLALLGGIQPGVIQEYVQDCLKDGAGNDGLLQRFGLTVWPDPPGPFEYVDRKPDMAAQNKAFAVFERLDQLQPGRDGEPIVWRYSPAAQNLFRDWLIRLRRDLSQTNLSPALASHLSKYQKLVPAMSLIFAHIDTPESPCVVHEKELARAIAWSEYLRTHAERLYSGHAAPANQKAASLLQKLRRDYGDHGDMTAMAFTPREIALKGWTGLGTSDEVRKAAAVLVDHGWLRKVIVPSADPQGRGRKSEKYQIHPDIEQA